jgi:hypothetical protein
MASFLLVVAPEQSFLMLEVSGEVHYPAEEQSVTVL